MHVSEKMEHLRNILYIKASLMSDASVKLEGVPGVPPLKTGIKFILPDLVMDKDSVATIRNTV